LRSSPSQDNAPITPCHHQSVLFESKKNCEKDRSLFAFFTEAENKKTRKLQKIKKKFKQSTQEL
jgi:hypothetical protein